MFCIGASILLRFLSCNCVMRVVRDCVCVGGGGGGVVHGWGCARRFCDMCWMAFHMFVFVLCAFFCPEHVCGCSLSNVCVCALVALVRPQRLCSEESNAYTNIAIYWCGHLCSAKGFSGSVHRNMWQHGFCVKLQMIFKCLMQPSCVVKLVASYCVGEKGGGQFGLLWGPRDERFGVNQNPPRKQQKY